MLCQSWLNSMVFREKVVFFRERCAPSAKGDKLVALSSWLLKACKKCFFEEEKWRSARETLGKVVGNQEDHLMGVSAYISDEVGPWTPDGQAKITLFLSKSHKFRACSRWGQSDWNSKPSDKKGMLSDTGMKHCGYKICVFLGRLNASHRVTLQDKNLPI